MTLWFKEKRRKSPEEFDGTEERLSLENPLLQLRIAGKGADRILGFFEEKIVQASGGKGIVLEGALRAFVKKEEPRAWRRKL